MTYTITAARYANSDHTAAVITTVEAADVLISSTDTPEAWADMLAWGTPRAFVPPVPPMKAELYKTDIIARMTDEELDAFDAALAAASTRERRMWTDCVTVRADSAYWSVLKAGFVAAFGQARADAIMSLD